MRTRKANKSKRFSFTETYGIESDDDSDRPAEVEDADEDDDVDFDVTQDVEGGQGASDDDEDDDDEQDAEVEDEEPLGGGDELGAVDGDGIVLVESEDDGVVGTPRKRHTRVPRGRGRWRKNLPKRTTVHAVPPYPTDLRKTRVYDGPLKRWTRSHQLLAMLYGPDQARLAVARGMFKKWFSSQVLPGKTHSGRGGVMSSPWLAEDYEVKQRQWARAWQERCRAAKQIQRSHKIRPEHIDMFRPPPESLVCFLGPFNNQTQARSSYGYGQPLLETGQPQAAIDPELQQEATPARGWLLDTGGLPLGIGWAPITGRQEQYLAVCTIPPSDQEIKLSRSPEGELGEENKGSVQIWSIPCHKADGSHARLAHHFWFDWGRPKRLQWCPIPSPDDSTIGLLAVLCGDGQVRVLEVPKPNSDQTIYEWITSPVATIGFTDEYMVHATSLAWVNTNRICLGHTDGSISLWSICPRHMLMRKSVHISYILDIASGFPSYPYHISSTPVGGCPTVTDLNLPSAETTYIPMVGTVNFQHNLVDWNDHLQGFFGMHPAPIPHNTIIGWGHIRYYTQSRTLMTTPNPPMCLASGRTHPFTLVGCADGSLWAINPLRILLKDRGDPIYKLKILQHEFRPPAKLGGVVPQQQQSGGEVVRGAARILQGFLPEMNSNPRAEYVREQNKKRNEANRRKSKGKGKKKALEEDTDDEDDLLTKGEGKALSKLLDETRAVVHDARTRIVVAAWNPNVEYGWWAAAAMGSGLVKIMDLGIGE
ncbi:hypothetical protein KVR01_002123 [Diaporthe batatas]|uniref:uncharacterized protein n=1 Tax=Diaporthe batatas TaxID=748121 RepID=UPI001D04A7EA|nr:uncharacterized protein KVR01_002123 [Diaporthe batatas]KAG8166434.1 hypothetical protein KVR01_002123 [Diaporthe batatas]